MARLTAGIIGYGERGKTLEKVIREYVSDINLVAVADPAFVRLLEAAPGNFEWGGLPIYQSAEELLEEARPQIVIITTNPPQHCEQVLMAAEHGCHILCEKPLALSPAEADLMVAAVRKAGVVCAVDFETVFSDSFDELHRQILREGFGRLIRFDAVDKGRPPAYDMETCMSHFMHAFMTLTGSRPVEVFGRVVVDGRLATLADVVPISQLYPQGRTHDIGMRADSIEASYLFANGVTVRYFLAKLDEDYVIRAGKHAKPGSDFMHFIACGTRGQVKWHQTSTGYVYSKPVPSDTLSVMDWKLVRAPEKPDPAWVVPTARLVQDFVNAIRDGHYPQTSIEEAAAIVDQVYGIYASHLAGRPVTLPLVERQHPLK